MKEEYFPRGVLIRITPNTTKSIPIIEIYKGHQEDNNSGISHINKLGFLPLSEEDLDKKNLSYLIERIKKNI